MPLRDAVNGGMVAPRDLAKFMVRDGEVPITGDRFRSSLCRSLDCVSLFDSGATAVDTGGQFGNWSGWFGHEQNARVAMVVDSHH